MTVCKACGSPVSRNAAACPGCGEPLARAVIASGVHALVGPIAFLALVAGVMWMLGVFR